MSVLSEADVRKIGTTPWNWSETPISRSNVRAIGLCGVGFVTASAAASHSPELITAIRTMAVMLAVALIVPYFQ